MSLFLLITEKILQNPLKQTSEKPKTKPLLWGHLRLKVCHQAPEFSSSPYP